MPKSPNVASMDYAIWEHLKQWLNKVKIETLDELRKKLLNEWKNKVTLTRYWSNGPKESFLIYRARGFHTEHKLKL